MNLLLRSKNQESNAELFRLNRLSKDRVSRLVAIVLTALLVLTSASPFSAKDKKKARAGESASDGPAVLWSEPKDIASRDLFYGPGGRAHEPHTTFTFIKEDLSGTNPKFDVRDENGVRWRVKLGPEARPETVASRLLWAVGYFANEDYFLPDLKVENIKRLKRGQNLVGPDGTMHNVRLKRYLKDEKKTGNWHWRENPFSGTRELNGLRVMMALINNWDLKDENNSIYEEKGYGGNSRFRYMVSDLGSSFGTTGLSFPHSRSKGNLSAYSDSKFIEHIGQSYVDFNVPTRPSQWNLVNPKEYSSRMRLRWIGHHIPLADARWIGQLLSQLSKDQIRQAFQAADYSPDEVDRYVNVLQKRISQLNEL